ncbi:MAG: hypothetical protein CVT49_08690 [candidate division Zixibacteria bacterium HGW-Zixibacteria-1]|nr:MAG: hypothetical protein CVT49_08690 [candidate division Zixibacteria bacterium HGW-Zixibacteria-1]
MHAISDLIKNKNVLAWTLMVSAVALHVADETIHDFLPFYNNLVLNLKDKLGFFPMPTFSFPAWLGGLITAVIAGYLVIPIVLRGGRVIRKLTIILGIIMTANALGHIVGSFYAERLIPGFWSSWILLPAAIFVIIRGVKASRSAPKCR